MFVLSPETVNTIALFVGLVIVSIYNHIRVQKAEKRADKRQGEAETRSAENKQDIKVVSSKLTETEEALAAAQSSIHEMQKNLELKQQTIDADSRAIMEVVKENQGLHAEREENSRRITTLESEIAQAKADLAGLRQQMEAATGERDRAVVELTEERRLNREAQGKLETANLRIAELEKQVHGQQVKIAALEMIFSRLQIVVTAPTADIVTPPAPILPPTSELIGAQPA